VSGRAFRAVLGAPLLLLALVVAATCSLSNQVGPDVTCADLKCGQVNACQEGIIASCADGKTLKFHVCDENGQDICEEDWQRPGQYRCDEFDIECDGCRPERKGCSDFAVDAGSGSGGGNGSGGGGAGP
jgi:hypothetical protein